ncbi:hypothetical protein [Acinetobacter sp. ANC 4641]|uniref:hypothetical protein n=1 Tax=Acinetobacter sp. ANC 4641 TaxID=2529847 RepID=UPI00103ACCCE|nr:hypothetical protein [Acinetobacter sp. ANC 4641]TCB12676.1 hypothetical protein E0H78_05685 [Acinetobacter sp. ANC 4641]
MSESSVVVTETASAVVGKVTTATGTGVTLVSWAASLDLGFLIGVGIGLAGLFISFLNFLSNRQFQKRKDKREQELHELEMKKLSGECDVEQD